MIIRNRTTKVPKGRKTTGRRWSPVRTEPLLMGITSIQALKGRWTAPAEGTQTCPSPRRGSREGVHLAGVPSLQDSTSCLWSFVPSGL
ncbi:MAG: hypothetical protein IJ635_05510 [Bacteroidaceae bacterium]|nr:hypothetical protein [Bacteroidaceae bacterium]